MQTIKFGLDTAENGPPKACHKLARSENEESEQTEAEAKARGRARAIAELQTKEAEEQAYKQQAAELKAAKDRSFSWKVRYRA